jgi:hypothetical protein
MHATFWLNGGLNLRGPRGPASATNTLTARQPRGPSSVLALTATSHGVTHPPVRARSSTPIANVLSERAWQ